MKGWLQNTCKLSFRQEIVNENKELKSRIKELEAQISKFKVLHDLAENAQAQIKTIQQEDVDHDDEMRKTLTDKYNEEIMCWVEEKVEAEQKFFAEKRGIIKGDW